MNFYYEEKKAMDLSVGIYSLFQKTVSDSDVMIFCGETGDLNPLYQNEYYGKASVLGAPVVPQMLVASMLGGAVYRLLNPNSFPIKRNFETIKPLVVGDTVTVRAEITELDSEKDQVVLILEAYNSNEDLIMIGTSVEQLVHRK